MWRQRWRHSGIFRRGPSLFDIASVEHGEYLYHNSIMVGAVALVPLRFRHDVASRLAQQDVQHPRTCGRGPGWYHPAAADARGKEADALTIRS